MKKIFVLFCASILFILPKVSNGFELGGGLTFHSYFSSSETRTIVNAKNDLARGFYIFGYLQESKFILDTELGGSYARKVVIIAPGNYYKKTVLSEYTAMLRRTLVDSPSFKLRWLGGLGIAEYLLETGLQEGIAAPTEKVQTKSVYAPHVKTAGNFTYYFGSHGIFAELGLDILLADKVDGLTINGNGWELNFGYSYSF